MEVLELAPTRRQIGVEWPADAFAYAPDPDKPSGWKLRIMEMVDGKMQITRSQLGAAAAAFSPGGFRGRRVQLPRNAVAPTKKRIREAYRSIGVENDDIPASVQMSSKVELLQFEAIPMFAESVNTLAAIDRENLTLRSTQVAQLGTAKGHGLEIDGTFLDSLVELGNAARGGIKVRFGHPKPGDSTPANFLGVRKNFRRQDDFVFADLEFSEAADQEKVDQVMAMAELHPTMIGSSVAVKGKRTENGDGLPGFEVRELAAVDIVDEPAVGSGMFSAKPQSEGDLSEQHQGAPKMADEMHTELVSLREQLAAAMTETTKVREQLEAASVRERVSTTQSDVESKLTLATITELSKNAIRAKYVGAEECQNIDAEIAAQAELEAALTAELSAAKPPTTTHTPTQVRGLGPDQSDVALASHSERMAAWLSQPENEKSDMRSAYLATANTREEL